MIAVGNTVKVKANHPHYPGATGTVSCKLLAKKLWWINGLERVIPTKEADKITVGIALADDEFDVLS